MNEFKKLEDKKTKSTITSLLPIITSVFITVPLHTTHTPKRNHLPPPLRHSKPVVENGTSHGLVKILHVHKKDVDFLRICCYLFLLPRNGNGVPARKEQSSIQLFQQPCSSFFVRYGTRKGKGTKVRAAIQI